MTTPNPRPGSNPDTEGVYAPSANAAMTSPSNSLKSVTDRVDITSPHEAPNPGDVPAALPI